MFRTLFNSVLKNPATMTDDDLECEWVRVKAKVLNTSSFTQKHAYGAEYDHASNLLNAVINRYRHWILDAECIHPFYKFTRQNIGSQISTNVEHCSKELLYGLTLTAYNGVSTATSGGSLISNPNFVMEALDYLVLNDDPIGYFLKGLVLKYGLQLYLLPNLPVAKQYLMTAQELGVGSAQIELKNLHIHERQLSNVGTVHIDSNSYQSWS